MYQTYRTKNANRSDHVWFSVNGKWKCCLCGAIVSKGSPPEFPTDPNWMPERYEKLNNKERSLSPDPTKR